MSSNKETSLTPEEEKRAEAEYNQTIGTLTPMRVTKS